MNRRSFQLRIALTVGLISGAILLGFSAAAGWLIWDQFIASIDARLLEPGGRLYGRIGGPSPDWTRLERELGRGLGHDPDLERLAVVYHHDNGRVEYVSEGAEWLENEDLAAFNPDPSVFEGRPPRPQPLPGARPPGGAPRPPPPPAPPVFASFAAPDNSSWRFVAISSPRRTLLVGKPIAAFSHELNPAIRTMLGIVPIGLILIALGSWWIAKRAVRPLKRISDTASQISAADLSARISETGQELDAFQDLIRVFNSMMERLEKSFHQATRFSSDASHELQTPIAILQAEVDTALKRCEPGSEAESALFQVASEAQRLKRITQSLLLLSRADAGNVKLANDQFNLSTELEAICEDGELLCEESNLTMKADISPNLEVVGDRTLLAQAIQNLLRNAVKYNQANGEVICELRKESDQAVFEIANTGSGIPQDQRNHIFDRFYRCDMSRSRKRDGFGLGLNLANEITRMHGGELELAESNDRWTKFRLTIPLAAS